MPPPYMPAPALSNGLSSGWYGAASLGLTYGAQNIARADGGAGQRFTIIPLPAQPIDELTMQARADAIASTYSGLLMQAVDLYRLTVKRNGFMAGILLTMSHGFLGLPLTWQGDEEMVSALMDVRDHGGNVLTPGDFARQHPENECAEIFSDGIGLGLGLGQYLLMCWKCDGVEWLRTPGPSDAHNEVETCKRCRAARAARPIGVRELYQLRWRDPRWLWRNIVTGQWYYTGRQGMIPITPGDGEWFMFQTVPDQDLWIHGPWALGTEAAIFARDARYDMQALSAMCAPTHDFHFKTSDPRSRRDTEEQAAQIRFQNMLFLPFEVEHKIESAQGGESGYVGTADRITSHSERQWEVYVTGISQGTTGGEGFVNNGVLQRVSRERRAFYAGAWIRQIVAQGLVWWARGNFGARPCPIGHYDTRSPEDKLAASKADTEEGLAIGGLVDGYAKAGYELDPAYVRERAQGKGLRVILKAGGHAASKIVLGVDGTNALLLGVEGRGALGLRSFGEVAAEVAQLPGSDARDLATVAALLDASKGAAAPGEPAPPAAAPVAPGGTPAPPGGSPPALPPARVERDEEQDDPDEDDDESRAKLAADLTAAGRDRCACKLLRAHTCPRCGVRRAYGIDPSTREPVVAWRATRRSARARATASDPVVAVALAKLDSALAALEEAGGATST